MKILGFLSLAFIIAGGAFAQQNEADTLKGLQLDDVIVVTGQYEPQSAQRSVYKVRTITSERIQARGAVKLQDVLTTELNIRFSQDLAVGGSNISMQGLEGQNVKVLIDGMPMVGRQGTVNEININQINVNMIDRIEIIEGPMSVVYGADALAGVINIITKKTVEKRIDLQARVHEESVGREYGWNRGIHNESVGLGYAWRKWNARLDVSKNYNGGWKGDSVGRDKAWHPKSQWMANSLIGFKSDRADLYYRLDFMHENIYNPGRFGFEGAALGQAIDQNYISDRLMHQLQGGMKFTDKLSFNGAISYTSFGREVLTTTVDEATGEVRLALSGQELTKFNGATFRSTVQYKIRDDLSLQPGLDLNIETGEGGRIKEGTQEIGDYAFFLSAEWKYRSFLHVRPGFRIIHNTVYQAPPIVPSLNTKFTLTDKQDIRLSYARGFRAPSLRELYFNFFDASHQIEGNPNLEAELSHSFNGSWNWKLLEKEDMKVTTSLGGFYNSVENKINYGLRSGTTITSYINIDRYKTKGFTWNNNLKGNGWDLSAGLGYTGRFNQLFENVDDLSEFNWSPEVTATASYRIAPAKMSVSLFYKYTGKTPYYEIVSQNGNDSAHLVKISAYQMADLSLQKEFGKILTLTGGIRNLFNVVNINSTSAVIAGAHSTGAIRPIGSGRSYFLSVSYSFNQ